MASPQKDRLRVIIVGGSIAGLTLAHGLDRSDIDFVLLEARPEIAPQVGASIVVLANGARILDQLGLFDDLLAKIEPLNRSLAWTGDGKCLVDSDVPQLGFERTGYHIALVERYNLLKVLYNGIPDKSKIQLSKRVFKVDHSDSGVVVHCQDGSKYEGDIVVGADGIHSIIRPLMLDHMESWNPGSTKKDRNSISAEYNCIFGLGKPVDGPVRVGDSHRTYTKDYSTLSFVGNDRQLYWFLFSKLDRRYYGKEIPKYTKADMEEAAKPFFGIHMTDTITFDQVWERRTLANISCVEEAQNDHWTSGRFVCLGDSIHKMTPNLGAGGNAAMESAAALTNALSKLSANPSLEDVQGALKAFYLKRHDRTDSTTKIASELTRLEAFRTLPDRFVSTYIIPRLGDFLADLTSDFLIAAELFETLPPPARSLNATMPWDPNMGIGKHESKWLRAVYALPIILFNYLASRTMGVTMAGGLDVLAEASRASRIILAEGWVVPLVTKYYGVHSIDSFVAMFVAFFTPSIGGLDTAGRMQAIAFLGDLVPIIAIWMVESIRRGNFLTAANLLPTIFGVLYQVKGIGFIAPIYFFLHYVQSPLYNYHAADNRLVQMGPVKTIIPTIALTYVLPSIAMFAAPTLATRQWVNGLLWQPFPLYAALSQRVLGYFVKDTTNADRMKNPRADMPYLRGIYAFAGAAALLANLYVRAASPIPIMDVFFKGISNPLAIGPIVFDVAKVLRYDHLMAFGSGAAWTMLSFYDLKRAGKVTAGWAKIVGAFTGITLVGGPGAAMVAMWAWREEALAKKRPVVLPTKK